MDCLSSGYWDGMRLTARARMHHDAVGGQPLPRTWTGTIEDLRVVLAAVQTGRRLC
jgi:hypothetical protein